MATKPDRWRWLVQEVDSDYPDFLPSLVVAKDVDEEDALAVAQHRLSDIIEQRYNSIHYAQAFGAFAVDLAGASAVMASASLPLAAAFYGFGVLNVLGLAAINATKAHDRALQEMAVRQQIKSLENRQSTRSSPHP